MASDALMVYRKGEKHPVYGVLTAPAGGTLLIQPGAVCTLYDSQGNIAGGINGVAITGYDSGPLATARVWYNLETEPLTERLYTLVFRAAAAGSDGLTRLFEPTALILIRPPGG